MTKIQVMLASASSTFEVQPNENLPMVVKDKTIQTEARVGMPLMPVAVLYSDSNEAVPGWEQAQRRVGSQDLTVYMRAASLQDTLSNVLQRLQTLETRSDATAQLLGPPRLSNAAAQMLRYALGDKLRATRSTRFAAAGAANLKIQQISEQTGVPAQDIVRQADAVITRRNNEHEHFPDLDALEHEVSVCVEFMNANPRLRQDCRRECWVLDNWAVFKAARPVVGR